MIRPRAREVDGAMKRVSQKRPGYNCGPGGSKCQHQKKGDHGIAADEWLYSVISDDGRHAVTLMVISADYPPDVDRRLFSERMNSPMGATLWFHEAAAADQGEPCDLLPCGRCTGDASYLAAQELWDEHHVGEQFEQPDSFWIALEARLPE